MLEIDVRHQPYEVDDLDQGSLLGIVAEHAACDLTVGRRQLRLAYRLAVLNPPAPDRPAAVAGDLALIANDCEDRIAGEGTPDIALFAVEDYSAAAGLTRASALSLVADSLDLHHRLPLLWAKVETLDVPAYKARRVAVLTRKLSYEAARWFDDHLHETGRTGWPTIERWIAFATAKFHPEQVKDANAPVGKQDWDVRLRHLNNGREEGSNGIGGTSELYAVGDSLDLERFHQLLCQEAERLKREGDTDEVAQRKAKAIGRLVDDTVGPDPSGQTGVDLVNADAEGSAGPGKADGVGERDACREDGDKRRGDAAPGPRPKMTPTPEAFARSAGRGLRIMVHANLADLLALDSAGNGPDGTPRVGSADRCGHVLISQVRDWITRHGSQAIITPVVDLNRTAEAVDRHDPPVWMADLVRMRDQHCVYPGCNVSAWHADLDHIDPYVPPGDGGPPDQTRPENLAPLCRRHHLVKTVGRWRYQRTDDGHYLWTNRHGHQYLVTPFGTVNLTTASRAD